MLIDLPDDWESRISDSAWAPSPMEQQATFVDTVVKLVKSWEAASKVPGPLDIVFTAPPGPGNECVLVDVEHAGVSVNVGYWYDRGGLGILRIPRTAIDQTEG